MSFVGQILICNSTPGYKHLYKVVRETPKCVFVQQVDEKIETIHSDALQRSTRVIGVGEPYGDVYRLLKREQNTFVGKADSYQTESYKVWDHQPYENNLYY